ncbi:MAG: hypothetical protein ACKN9V_08455, partial [Pseudomonadota bacterium]
SQRLIRKKDGKGRIPALEILINTVRVKEMILDSSLTQDIRRAIEEGEHVGMQTFDQSLMELHRKELITEEEALLHCSNIQDFQLRLEGVVPGQWERKGEEIAKSRKQRIAEAIKNKETEHEKIEVDDTQSKKAS